MTDAMWFAWLSVPEFSAAVSPGNLEAQRDFVAWWTLFGKSTYPRIWNIDERVMSIALEQRLIYPFVTLPRILAYIYDHRQDLRMAFPMPPLSNRAALALWYGRYAANEYSFAPPLPEDFMKSVSVSPPKVLLSEGAKVLSGELRKAAIDDFSLAGVNLIGYPRGEFGIGEDIRMAAAALDTVGIPYAIFEIKAGAAARQADLTFADKITGHLPFAVNLICTSPFDTARIYLELGGDLFSGRYTIGYWPWELESFPGEWAGVFGLVDEVWAGSQFTARCFAPLAPKLRYIPPAVEAVAAPAPDGERQIYQFVCAFDPNSALERKNPAAAVRAFRQAFPGSTQDVRLVLAVNGQLPPHEQTDELRAAARGDDRIVLRERTVPRAEHHNLIAGSDCLLSPHRAEGFGRNIAEAKSIGIAVLATGYSGSVDFLDPREAVGFRLRPVAPGEYPFGIGAPWAEIDVDDLAIRMKAHYERRISSAVAPLSPEFSVPKAGERMKIALAEIGADLRARRNTAAE